MWNSEMQRQFDRMMRPDFDAYAEVCEERDRWRKIAEDRLRGIERWRKFALAQVPLSLIGYILAIIALWGGACNQSRSVWDQ